MRVQRFRVRTLMIVVAAVAGLLAAKRYGEESYRRWCYYQDEAASLAVLEAKGWAGYAQEIQAASDREAIRRSWMASRGFADRSAREQEETIENTVNSYRRFAADALAAARHCAEQRKECERAAFWAFSPFSPSVPAPSVK
jgi:hypothetical protein